METDFDMNVLSIWRPWRHHVTKKCDEKA